MSGYVGFADLKIAKEKKERERAEREAAERDKAGTPAESAAAARTTTPSTPLEEIPKTTLAEKAPSPWRNANVAESARVADSATLAVVSHYTKTLNAIYDDLLPTLKPAAQLVYLQLYRLTYGHGRTECRVSRRRLANRCNMGETAVREALGDLIRRRLIERVEYAFGGDDKGVTLRVNLPDTVPASAVRVAESARVARNARVADSAPMKENMKDMIETARVANAPAPVDKFELRKKAARLLTLHEREAGYTHKRLCDDLRSALVADGLEVDEALIEAATAGMGA